MITKRIGFNLALAGVVLAVCAGLIYAKSALGAEAPLRGAMALSGIVWAIYANAYPKALSGSARKRAIRRVTGWTFVLAGFAYSAVWVFSPIEIANLTSLAVVGAGFICVVSYCLWRRSNPA